MSFQPYIIYSRVHSLEHQVASCACDFCFFLFFFSKIHFFSVAAASPPAAATFVAAADVAATFGVLHLTGPQLATSGAPPSQVARQREIPQRENREHQSHVYQIRALTLHDVPHHPPQQDPSISPTTHKKQRSVF